MPRLEQLCQDLQIPATRYGYEARIVGSVRRGDYGGVDDGRILKLCPLHVRTLVVLEVVSGADQRPCLYKHRDPTLTKKFKGRAISLKWITRFMEANAGEAKAATQRELSRRAAIRPEPEPLTALYPPRPPSIECHECHGEGRWFEGSLRDGDSALAICSACHGSGWVDAEQSVEARRD